MEIIDKSIKKQCNCKGKIPCKECINGIYKEPNYILVTETQEGQKIAFDMDFLK
ncbi:MAG: hypothetical protein M0R03_08830 [Novosphingobium sp.]|nr:hypothetical protein [Novosphingobium sp.]